MHIVKKAAAHLEWLTFERLGAALLFLAIGVGACFSPAQNDTWWHLRAGEDIWTAGAIDLRDHYSHTVNGGYWPNHEWLSQVLFFAVYRVGGLALLTSLAATFVVAAWWLVWRLTPGDRAFRLMLCTLALIPSSLAWALRPQVFTLFLLAATAFLLVRRRYLMLPPLFLIWANLHGAVMLGFPLLAGGIVASTIEERKWPVRLLVVTGLCIVATTITPLGASLWADVPATLARTRPYGIAEWRAPGLVEPVFMPFWLLAGVLVVLTVRAQPWRVSSGSSVMIWSALAMLPLAVTSGRNVPPFVLLAVPAIAAMRDSLKPARRRASARIEHPLFNAGILVMLSLVASATVSYAWISEIPRLGWHPLPQPAIAALAACPDPLYNRYDEGGYLIWFVRGRKVFLDSREHPYPAALVHDQIRTEITGDYRALFDRHAIRCALVAADSPVAQQLVANGWKKEYQGLSWVVLTRGFGAT
jgi:hypothetical protein